MFYAFSNPHPENGIKELVYEAFLYLGLVWIILFSLKASYRLDIFECIIHKSSITTFIAEWSRAVHQLLLTEGKQFTRLAKVLSLKRTSLKQGKIQINIFWTQCNME